MADALSDPAVQAIFGLLINRTDVYLAADRRSCGWYCRKAPLTPVLVQAALHGQVGLGIYATSEAMTSKWLCLDVDAAEDMPALLRLAVRLSPGSNVLLERSRRGGHLWLFCPPTPWQQVRAVGRALAMQAGLRSVEVFPKWEGLNGVKLPGSRHAKSGFVYPAINPLTGEVLDARRVLLAMQPQPVPEVELRCELPPPVVAAASTGDFGDLVHELAKLTRLRAFGSAKAMGRCPWHDDQHPSMLVKGGRFHCLASSCGCWGDVADVRRFIEQGIVPPKG